jgi:hypothetical protein
VSNDGDPDAGDIITVDVTSTDWSGLSTYSMVISGPVSYTSASIPLVSQGGDVYRGTWDSSAAPSGKKEPIQ